ncbi:unnamed protein product [Amaranthus hypochondriacus]
MVLWEITLATAYFLGLRRTYRLALKIQRRLIPKKHLKIRHFAQRRTRAVFDVALRVHRNIQERDIEVGRNLGNWILRWLDKVKPSANIRGDNQEKLLPPKNHNYNSSMSKQTNSNQKNNDNIQRFSSNSFKKGSDRNLFSATKPTWPTSFPSITMMMRHPKPVGNTTQYRQLCYSGPQLLTPSYRNLGLGRVIREDIRLWMQRN